MTANINTEITIRRMDIDERDRAAVAQLAGRDSRAALDGPVLGLEIEGRLVAASSLNNGESIADPFARTAELRGLLELRTAQLRRRNDPPKRGLRGPRRRRRPAVGGSPAGSIISLPRWG